MTWHLIPRHLYFVESDDTASDSEASLFREKYDVASVYLARSDDVAFNYAELVCGGVDVTPDSTERISRGAADVTLDLAERVSHGVTEDSLFFFLFLLEEQKVNILIFF